MRFTQLSWSVGVLLFALCRNSPAQGPERLLDSDRDGLNDRLEQALLLQFAPSFRISRHDCSNYPAEFNADSNVPLLKAENGTIYGQVFPAKGAASQELEVEIHYYHLWKSDCGAHGHLLDTEHVSTLVRKASNGSSAWRALYWYAAAHEHTVCDVSQIARAATIGAENHGATVWISPAKHASYLNGNLCQRGCGSDRCEDMTVLEPGKLINLGEPGFPMNGSSFLSSSGWPLQAKMASSDFPARSIARLEQIPSTDIALVNAGRHPAQGVIAISSTTQVALAGSAGSTSEALKTSYRSTVRALSNSVKHTGKAMRLLK